ncbi:hypothetical protein IW262DRAFT_1452467 [Armillaria fumosa]|nr:hypothetical protein IW262DRAFT_1452467 [Armillaria fumosa]
MPINQRFTCSSSSLGSIQDKLICCPIAAAFSHTIHFPGSSFSWSHNAAMDVYHRKPGQDRYRCANCGTVVACHNAESKEWSVYGGQMERDEAGKIKHWELLKPTAHIFYDTRMLDVLDDLGKWDGVILEIHPSSYETIFFAGTVSSGIFNIS